MSSEAEKYSPSLEVLECFHPAAISTLGEWKDLFLKLFELSKELLFVLDQEGNIIAINKSGAQFLEYSPSELIGKHFSEFVEVDNIQTASDFLASALKDGNASFEINLQSRFDKLLKFQLSIQTVVCNKKIVGLLAMGKNVTRLRKLEKELRELQPKLIEAERLIAIERSRIVQQKSLLEELNRLKNEFVSNISHELRTPLASIVGFSETIASDPNMPEEMKIEFNLIILNEGKRLAKLINDILDLSRMETGKIVLNKGKVNIPKLLKKVIDGFVSIANSKNLVMSVEIPAEDIFIEADEERIEQSFHALMNNAVKFTKDFGRIKIIINNMFKEVEIIIADTGIGIPKEEIPNIFQKFHKISRPDEEISGAGVGLVFVKQIVDLHKGLISIQSEVNKGTTVIIRLLKNIKDKN